MAMHRDARMLVPLDVPVVADELPVAVEVAQLVGLQRVLEPGGHELGRGRVLVGEEHAGEGVAALAAAEVEHPGSGRQQREDLDDVVVRAAHSGDGGVPIPLLPERINGHAGTYPSSSASTVEDRKRVAITLLNLKPLPVRQ